MIKAALQYIEDLRKERIIESNGMRYTEHRLERLDDCLRASALKVSTLSSLVEYIKGNVDVMAEKMLIQVVSPTEVRLLSQLDSDRKRECLMSVEAELPDIKYGKFMDCESFLISLRSNFISNYDTDLLLKFAGTVEAWKCGVLWRRRSDPESYCKERNQRKRGCCCTESGKLKTLSNIYGSRTARIRICFPNETE